MKKLLILLAIVTSFVLVGCTADDDTDATPSTQETNTDGDSQEKTGDAE